MRNLLHPLTNLNSFDLPLPPSRPKRVTGAALAAAVALLDAAGAPRSPGRVVSVLSGPCTAGPGLVVSRDYSDQLRSHHDLHSDKTLYFR